MRSLSDTITLLEDMLGALLFLARAAILRLPWIGFALA
jgi:hypothetical protein